MKLPHIEVKEQALALVQASPDINPFQDIRAAAQAKLKELDFPHRRVEAWKYTNVVVLQQQGHLLRTADGNAQVTLPEPIFKHRLVFVNGVFNEKASSELPAGVIITQLKDAASLPHPELEQELPAPFALLNSATLQDGLHITVADNTTVDAPIEVLFVSQDAQASHCNTRLHVDIGENSELTLLERYEGQGPVLTNAVTNIAGKDSSRLVHYRLQAEAQESAHVGSVLVVPGANSVFRSYQLMHGTALRRNDVRTIINHEDAEVNMKGVFVGNNNTHTDNQLTMEHRVPNSRSNMVYKGMAGDKSTLVFNGSIHIHPGAFQTVADLTNNNLLLNRGATVNTKPELIIYNDDVICSHGTTCGELEDDAIFFLRSRGLTEEQAEKMLSLAFINEVLLEMPNEEVADWARPWLNGIFANQEDAS